MFTKILDFKVFNEDKDSLINYIEKLSKVNIISGNPEVLFNGLNNPKLKQNFNDKNSVIIPDGVGTVLASKLLNSPVKEKIAGIDVVKEIFIKANQEGKSIYLLGSREEVLTKCVKNIETEFPNLKIVGSHNGFFDLNNCENIIQEIKLSEPWAIFVAMGSPRQEIFIEKIMPIVNTKVFMGVGGVFDIFAGELKRAPKWMISLGLEWLYRVIKEPFRIKRLISIPKFLLLVLKNKN
ncbi:WecB/TagA/CpsF family glycosyltransferase [Clostridium saccharobutylicum]|uniref:N-acetylglucosaminyldiphosphoundecaprenol N-acetyl-beta-D-mannosaminyltransferase n=1 Tax=Clostridium saccharobutylicum DSM 13864 TaxID=1345695 RepID=U5MN51_CLOSA|nr:WecB/TagA/CpsF family glycosyltransferase [Clostridium saccharobutylicum]AGX42234.1 putative N-acetylmannosaminyltransferase TagA [Clostridium saccharobutylicum DSM 13864]AQR89515.1 putative N-acetylmannosaminyltransferase [Clostridium saccharobutylicum]AQR99417.1 putative N-acetylmannosaminyltransferase [Clostridium saccharobutylicum]AQS09148.1 putative N-acetylmannosaminyltransferase [Clostridium saccharobutylicum]AQS13403.1 putative N-acetylmannosaminyltransferase [Clostridium saccharobu